MPRVAIPPQASGDRDWVWAQYAPQITSAARAYSLAVYANTGLRLREFEAVRGRIALINGCQSCGAWRSARDVPRYLEGFGETANNGLQTDEAPDEAFYAGLADWRNASLYSDRERLVIEFGERMALDHRSLEDDDAFWARLKSVLSDDEIVDLSFTVASFIAFGRVNRVLDIDGACRIPQPTSGHAQEP